MRPASQYTKARMAEVRRLRKEGREVSPESKRRPRGEHPSHRVDALSSGMETPDSLPSTPPLGRDIGRDSMFTAQDYAAAGISPPQSPDARSSKRLSQDVTGVSAGTSVNLSVGSAYPPRNDVSTPTSPSVAPQSRPTTPLQPSLSARRLQRHLSASSAKSSTTSSPSASPGLRLPRHPTRSHSQSSTPTRTDENEVEKMPSRSASYGASATPTGQGVPLLPRTSSLEVPTRAGSSSPVSMSASGDSSSLNPHSDQTSREHSAFSSPARSRSTSNANPSAPAVPLQPLVATSIRSSSLSSGAVGPSSPIHAPGSRLASLNRSTSWGQRSEEREEDRRRSGILDQEDSVPSTRRSRMKRVFRLGRKE